MRIRIGELELGYDDAGDGLPIVFLHGFPHHRKLWAPQLRALAGHCRCIAADLRGFGESVAPPPFSVDQWADDTARLLDALGIERAMIAGLSMGGYIAFAFWRRHRARALALVLADTRAAADTEDGRRKRRDTIELARRAGAEAVVKSVLPGQLGKSTRERHPAIVESLKGILAGATVESIAGASEAMMARPDSTGLLATIDVPALIVVGDEDVLTPVKDARAMHEAIPSSRLEIIPGAGHVSNFERPAAFNQILSEFVQVAQDRW